MKKILHLVVVGMQISALSAATLAVPNGDFSNLANQGSISGNLFGGQSSLLGSGPWSAATTPVLLSLLPPTAEISGGAARVTGLLGALGQSNTAQFSQTLSGQSYQANQLYTLSATIDSGASLNLTLLGTNGIGIALTAGGNPTVLANSLLVAPSFVSLTPVGGTVYTLSLQYLTSAAPPAGDIGIRLFAGVGASLATANLLGDVTFDNVTLSAVPEPATAGLAMASLAGFLIFGFRRRRALSVVAAVMAMGLALTGTSQAALLNLNTDNRLAVTLLPNATYEIEIEVTTGGLGSLLDILRDNEAPLQLLDPVGNVLGSVSSEELLTDLIDGDEIPLLNGAGGVLGLVSTDDLVARLLGTVNDPLEVTDQAGNVIGTVLSPGLVGGLLDLLGGLLGSGNVPLLGDSGNILGQVSLDELLGELTGSTGGLNGIVTMLLTTASDSIIEPVLGVLDSPIIQIGGTTVNAAPASNSTATITNQAPGVKITKRQRKGARLILRGTAVDADGQVTRVEVVQNGRLRKAKGTGNWRIRLPLREGRNQIVVRAFDNAATASATKRVTMTRK